MGISKFFKREKHAEASKTVPPQKDKAPPKAHQPSSDALPPVAQVSRSQDATTTPASEHSNEVLRRALEMHVSSLPDAEQKLYLEAAAQPTTIGDLWDPVKQQNLSHEHQSFLRTHSDGITKFMSTLDRFLDLSAAGLSASPQFVGIAVGATRVVIQIFTGFLSYYTRLSSMFGTFASYFESLNKWAETATQSQNIQEALKIAYVDILAFLRSARLVFVNAKGEQRNAVGWRIFWRNFWKPFEEEFSSVEQEFKDHLHVLTTASSAENLSVTFQLLKAETDRRDRERREKREAFLRWLSADAAEDVHDNIMRKKHPGTSDWILQEEYYRTWLDDSQSRLVWCHGKAGSGKSVLASNVIENLTAQKAPDDEIALAFIYLEEYRKSGTQDVRKVITALIKQLCRKSNIIPETFYDTKAESESALQLGNFESFKLIAEQYKELYLVIDGLDELPRDEGGEPRASLLQFLSNVIQELPLAKVFVTSRWESDIRDEFEALDASIQQAASEQIQHDIEKYVVAEVKRLRQSKGAKRLRIEDDILEKDIVDVLTSKADGMFLWVDLQLKHLCEASRMQDDSEIRKALDQLPKGLDATYARNVQQIDTQYSGMRDLAIVIFQWVLYCERSLTLEEVQHAIAFQKIQDGAIGEKLKLGKPDVIIDACANLLEIVKIGSNDPILRPIHYSVQEYMTKSALTTAAIEKAKLLGKIEGIHSRIAITSMRYLVWMHEQHIDSLDIAKYGTMQAHALTRYAADSFDFHLSRISPLDQDSIAKTAEFLEHSDRFRGTVLALRLRDSSINFADIDMLLYATRLYNLPRIQEKYQSLEAPPDALVFACSAGLENAVNELLRTGVDIEAKATSIYDKDTPLIAAIRKKHIHIVDILLKKGADPRVPNGRGPNQILPLQLACSSNTFKIVELLVRNGADVNDRLNKKGRTAIQAAAYSGRLDMVKFLLENGASTKADGDIPDTTLHYAAQAGSREVVDFLLDRGADINSDAGSLGTPLHALIGSPRPISNMKELVRYFISRNADVNGKGGHFGGPLQAAVQHGDLEIVEFLLSEGADINSVGGNYGSPLLAALAFKRQVILEHLIDRSADLNATGGRYGNALQAACDGDIETIKFIFRKGADVNIVAGYYGTALQRSATLDSLDVAKLFLEEGADVNIQAGHYNNALMAALSTKNGCWDQMTLLLLNHGADPNSKSFVDRGLEKTDAGWFKSKDTISSMCWAIGKAAEWGDPAVCSQLIEKGANVNAQGGEHGNALQIAAKEGHYEIVRLLLQAGADVNAMGGMFGTALQAAAAFCHLNIVKLLLDAGADVNADGGLYGNALNAAERAIQPAIASLLRERGAISEDSESESESELEEAEEGADEEGSKESQT